MVILALAAIALTLVQIRRNETTMRHDILRYQLDMEAIKRTWDDQTVREGILTAPPQVLKRAESMSLNLTDPSDQPGDHNGQAPSAPPPTPRRR